MPPVPETTSKTVSRKRQQTRQRLLDAALTAFADDGFGRTTVERVCEEAGFTRGAFYSNFTSLDELFLVAWEQKSTELVQGLRAAFDAEPPDAGIPVAEALAQVLDHVPADSEWHRVSLEFTAHALRNPELRQVVAAREAAIIGAILPIVTQLLERAGRTVTDPEALGHALVAIHDGTLAQCLLEPDDEAPWVRRRELFLHVLLSYTTEESPT